VQDIPLDVVHEDEHLLVVNKAAGMVVHPAPGNFTGTLVNALLHRYGLPGLRLPADGCPAGPPNAVAGSRCF
jgi:23S rRNA-/tRNA-specific pseudouridylate synthase